MTTTQLLHQYESGLLSIEDVREKLALIKKNQNKSLLSQGQEGLWALQKLYPKTSAYNCRLVLKLFPEVSIDLFEQACQLLVQQFPILQTVISEENGNIYQKIDASKPIVINKEDLSFLETDQFILQLKEKAKKPFSFEKESLFRVHFIKNPKKETIVLFTVHHLIFDGSSVFPLCKTLINFYRELSTGKKPEPKPSKKSYRDFVLAEKAMINSKEGERRLSYWKEELKGPLLPLEFPTDFARLPEKRYEGTTYSYTIDAELASQMKRFSTKNAVYLSTLFLSVFQLLLHRYTGQEEIIAGMPFEGRNQAEYREQIGFFINMIPVRSSFAQDASFFTLLKELQLTIVKGIAHSYPFTTLLRKLKIPLSSTHSPVFQVGYFYQNFIGTNTSQQQKSQHPDLFSFEHLGTISQEGEYEIALEVFERETEFFLNLKYDPNLYKESTICRFLEHYLILLKKVLQTPEQPCSKCAFLSETEKKTLLLDWNQTKQTYPEDRCFYELFTEQVEKTPTSVAVVVDDHILTYRELDDKSTILANYLQIKGIKRNKPVAICVDRSLEMIIGLLAIQKSGGAYVPLDPDYPTDRLSYMLQDSGAEILLTHSKTSQSTEQIVNVFKDNAPREEPLRVSIDEQWAEISKTATQQKLEKQAEPASLAYIIYTSGSTGKPKGVMISNRSLVNFLCSMKTLLQIQREDRFLAVTTYCFDIAALELYLPLLVGAECKIAGIYEQKDPKKLLDTIKKYKPSMMQATPVTWKLLFEMGWKNPEKMKILCGGEALPLNLRQEFINSRSESWNLFGPTETTIWSTSQKITRESSNSIGKPIANTRVYIVDTNEQLTPVGVVGELCIAGDGVAEGYWNRPELTKEKFVSNPFSQNPESRIYKTGDLARWLPDGTIEFLGRMDQQVKHHGFRIELGEIENVLNSFPGIKQSVVVLQEEPVERLIAYYVPSSEKRENSDLSRKIMAYAQDKLPEYMIPSFCFPIRQFPLTPNRKIDRKQLKQKKIEVKKGSRQASTETTVAQLETEKTVLKILEKVLQVEGIGIHDSFFEVGGNSILAVILSKEIQQRFLCEFSPIVLFKYNTVRSISQHITKNSVSLPSRPEPVLKEPSRETLRDSSNQDGPGRIPLSEPSNKSPDSIAIIGMSGRFPMAKDLNEFWENLKSAKNCITEIPEDRWSMDGFFHPNPIEAVKQGKSYSKWGGFLQDFTYFDALFFQVSPEEAKFMDPQQCMFLEECWHAFEDAGYAPSQLDTELKDKVGVYGAISTLGQNTSFSSLVNRVSYFMDLRGPSIPVDTKCSSSVVALHQACESLRHGEIRMALVGAVNLYLNPDKYLALSQIQNISDSSVAHVFGEGGKGFVPSEGVGTVVLKRLSDAEMDNDTILAVIRGSAINHNGKGNGYFVADPVQQTNVIKKALEKSQVDPQSIGYVESAANGSEMGDAIEMSALQAVFQAFRTNNQKNYRIGSLKPNLGHGEAVSGMAQLMKVVLQLKNNVICPTPMGEKRNPNIDFETFPFKIQTTLSEWPPLTLDGKTIPRRAGIFCTGAGGVNACMIVEEYLSSQQHIDQRETRFIPAGNSPQIIVFSAKTPEQLDALLNQMLHFVSHSERKKSRSFSLSNFAYTLQVGRDHMESRLAMIVSDFEELIRGIKMCLKQIYSPSEIPIFERVADSNHSELERLFSGKIVDIIVKTLIEDNDFEKIALYWSLGAKIPWQLMHNKKKARRIPLPTYPFAKDPFWTI